MRTLQVLDTLANSDQELGPSALAARLSLHRSTVHRLLLVLERNRLIQRSPGATKYRLGMKLFELGSSAVAPFDLCGPAEPFLAKLAGQTGEDAHICVLDGASVLSINMVPGRRSKIRRMSAFQRGPVPCTSAGKIFLAFLPEVALDRFIVQLALTRHTDRTLVTADALKDDLERVRERGFAFDQEERQVGLCGIAAPIYDRSIYPRAALMISGPAGHFRKGAVPQLAEAVLKEARALSGLLQMVGASTRPQTSGPRTESRNSNESILLRETRQY